MHGFSGLDITSIIGSELNLLGLSRYDVQLNFTAGVKICIQGELELFEDGIISAIWDEKNNWSSINFQKLLNARVEGFQIPHEHLLEIRFSNGITLQIRNNDNLEVVQIYFKDPSKKTIII